MIDTLADGLLYIAITVLLINMVLILYRAIKGPRITDTLLAINVINVKAIVVIAMIGVIIGENYIIDVSLVYAIIGFIAVSTFARIIIQNAEADYQEEEGEVE